MISVKIKKEGFRAFKVGRKIEVTREVFNANKEFMSPVFTAKSVALDESIEKEPKKVKNIKKPLKNI